MRPRGRAARAFGQGGRPAGDAHCTQQVGVEHQLAGPDAVGHRTQRPDGQPVQCGSRCALLTREPFGGLQHRAGAGVAAVVGDDVAGEGVDRRHLRDDVEVAAGMQLDVDVGERLQPGAELAAGAADPLGDRAHQPVIAGEQGDDAVGFAELVLAQHNRPVPVQPHRSSLSPRWDNVTGTRR
jgi:hypothetical protein